MAVAMGFRSSGGHRQDSDTCTHLSTQSPPADSKRGSILLTNHGTKLRPFVTFLLSMLIFGAMPNSFWLFRSSGRFRAMSLDPMTATVVDQQQHHETTVVATQQTEAEQDTGASAAPQNSASKPLWVLHAGLPKTGTTHLQCTLCGHKNVTNDAILMQDKFYYIGTCPIGACRRDPLPKFKFSMVALDRRIDRTVKFAEEQNYNVLMNTENMWKLHSTHTTPESVIQNMKQKLSAFDLWVIVTYRPLHSWLLSWYNQQYKRIVEKEYWPGELNAKNVSTPEVPPFDLDDRPLLSPLFYEYEVVEQKLPAHLVYDMYKKHIPNVHILPSHQTPSQIEYIFCTILPSAPHICEQARAGNFATPDFDVNPSVALDVDILAVAAWRAGLVPPKARRATVSRYIVQRLNELASTTTASGYYELPLQQCLSQEKLDRLENLSLSLERRLFKNTWTAEQEQKHHEGFVKAVEQKKFCSVNTTAVFDDPDWRSFFQSIPLG